MTTPQPAGQASAPDWKNLPERSTAGAMRFMAWLSVRAGRRMTRVVVYAIAAYFYFFGGSSRRASRDYLERALGKPPTALQQYGHILHFATVIHDRIFFLKGRFALFDIQLHGDQLFAHDHAQGIPLLLMGAHVGSFEALRALGEKTGIRVSMLMYQDNAVKMNAALAALNPDPAPKVISLQRVDAMLLAQADLCEGRVLGMLADRRLAHEPVDDYPFLGAPAAFPRNPYRLAYILKCKVYFMAALYLGGNRYAIHLVPLADFSREPDNGDGQGRRAAQIAAAQEAYVRTLEATTRSAVSNWFNFYNFWRDAKGGRQQWPS